MTMREMCKVILFGAFLFGAQKSVDARINPHWDHVAIGGSIALVSGLFGEYFREGEVSTNKQLDDLRVFLDKAREKLEKMGIGVTEEPVNGAYTLLLKQIKDLEKQAKIKRIEKAVCFSVATLSFLYGVVNLFKAFDHAIDDAFTDKELPKEELDEIASKAFNESQGKGDGTKGGSLPDDGGDDQDSIESQNGRSKSAPHNEEDLDDVTSQEGASEHDDEEEGEVSSDNEENSGNSGGDHSARAEATVVLFEKVGGENHDGDPVQPKIVAQPQGEGQPNPQENHVVEQPAPVDDGSHGNLANEPK